VAHGIRNPLAIIRSSAELSLGAGAEQWREAAQDVVYEVDRLETWVRELLSYSQPIAGKPEPIQVLPLMQASLQSFERELERRSIRASTRVGERLPPVTADPLMLGQVFNSLISNAVEAIERNGRITVSVLREGDRRLRVSIQDTGPGMTREQLATAFKPFHTTKARGLGLGLPLAKRIVERFGGTITMASHVGQGTTIDVLLPAA
jgi:signal transduction histidine kinase